MDINIETETKRILFITLSCVGDVVMSTPLLESIHNRFPGAVIDIVADKRSSNLLVNCPYKGEIFHKDKKKFLRGGVELLKSLWAYRYDLIVDIRTDGFAYLLSGRKRLTKWGAKPYGSHAVEQLMGVICSLHGSAPIPKTHIWLDEKQERFAEQALSALPEGKWLAFGPACGGKELTKAWPEEKYAALANNLKDAFAGVMLVGGPADEAILARISKKLNVPYVDLHETDLLQAAATIKRANVYVGSDSGLGHVAGAVGTPTLSFFSTDAPARCLPWGNKAAWLMREDRDARLITVEEAEEKIRKELLSV